MKVTESQIQSIIIRYLSILENQDKLWFTRFNNIPPVQKGANGAMQFRKLPPGSKKGAPDIIVLTKGCFIGLEVKTPTGRQSSDQKIVESLIQRQDCSYYVVRSLEEVQEILKKFGV